MQSCPAAVAAGRQQAGLALLLLILLHRCCCDSCRPTCAAASLGNHDWDYVYAVSRPETLNVDVSERVRVSKQLICGCTSHAADSVVSLQRLVQVYVAPKQNPHD